MVRWPPWTFGTWLLLCATVQADAEYALASSEWFGLSAFADLARAHGDPELVDDRLDIGTLSPDDGLILFAPTHPLPVDAIAEFMKAGGRVALIDDHGSGAALLALYRMSRSTPDTRNAPKLRGNHNLPAAAARSPLHPLAEGVPALVANHPEALFHPELEPIFAFDPQTRHGLVVAGAVGRGRLVAISDPSLFINNMLELRGNERFARNLLAYLTSGGGGRIVLVSSQARVSGRFGEPGADRPLHDLAGWLRDLSRVQLPPMALRLAALTLACLMVVAVLGALPRKTPYAVHQMFAAPPLGAGFAGRVSRPVSAEALTHALLVYKFEFEATLLRITGKPSRTLLRELLPGLAAHGLGAGEVRELRGVLVTLDELAGPQTEGRESLRITPKALCTLVDRGERLLARLETNRRP